MLTPCTSSPMDLLRNTETDAILEFSQNYIRLVTSDMLHGILLRAATAKMLPMALVGR